MKDNKRAWLAKLEQEEIYLYLILKSFKYLSINKLSYTMIKEVFPKKISSKDINNLYMSLVSKGIIKNNKFILNEGSKNEYQTTIKKNSIRGR